MFYVLVLVCGWLVLLESLVVMVFSFVCFSDVVFVLVRLVWLVLG